jgi:hypothetical protein
MSKTLRQQVDKGERGRVSLPHSIALLAEGLESLNVGDGASIPQAKADRQGGGGECSKKCDISNLNHPPYFLLSFFTLFPERLTLYFQYSFRRFLFFVVFLLLIQKPYSSLSCGRYSRSFSLECLYSYFSENPFLLNGLILILSR